MNCAPRRSRAFVLMLLLALFATACGGKSTPEAGTPHAGSASAQAPSVAPAAPEQTQEPAAAGPGQATAPPEEDGGAENEGIGGGGEGIVVTQTHAFADQFNTWRIVGEVRNNTPETATSVELLFEIRDASGAPILNDVSSLLVANLAPGGAAPFSYTINDPSIAPDSYDVFVTSSSPTDIVPQALDVVNTNMVQDDFGDFHCTGEVVNNRAAPVDIDGLAAAVIDASGNILTADWFWAVSRHLEPGASSPFRASPFGPAEAPAECRIYVDARQSESIPTYPVTVLSTRFYRDTFQTGHLVGEVRNDGGETLTIQLIAGLYAADGRVIDADFASIPVAVGPSETAAFDFTTLSVTNYSQAAYEAVTDARVAVDPFWTYPALTQQTVLNVDNLSADSDGTSVLLTGNVVNNQDFNADFTVVTVRFRDGSGNVIAQGYTSIYDPIPVGATAPFDMRVYLPPDVDLTTLSYDVVAKTDLP